MFHDHIFRFITTSAAVLSFSVVASEHVAHASANGLTAHWPLNERSGTRVFDTVGSHHGVLKGVARRGSELDFDGVNDYVDIGDFRASGTALTLAASFKSDHLDNCEKADCRILSRSQGVAEQSHDFMLSTFQVGKKRRLRFRVRAGGKTTTLIATSGDLVNGRWTHATATFDGKWMRLFKDGILVGRVAKRGRLTTSARARTWIGGNAPGPRDRPWNGRIKDVRIYKRALLAHEIEQLARGGAPENRPVEEPTPEEPNDDVNKPKPEPPVNRPPTATNSSFSTEQGVGVDIKLSGSDRDGDLLIFSVVTRPRQGELSGEPPFLVYTPKRSFTGTDSFQFQVKDGRGGSARGRVDIRVQKVTPRPVGTVRAIQPSEHPNLYFNAKEIARIRSAVANKTSSAATAAWQKIRSIRAAGKPAALKTKMKSWRESYRLCQPLSKRNMKAAMSYMIEPTPAKEKALKSALLSWTSLQGEGNNWARGSQNGGHMQYPLAWMYDLLYNTGSLSREDKAQVDAYMQKYAKILTVKRHGVLFAIDERGNRIQNSQGKVLEDPAQLRRLPRSVRVGYDNFYILDQTAGLVFAMVSHSQAMVDRIFETDVADNNYGINDPAFNKGHIRSLRNLIEGEVYPDGYTYDGYKRNYGFKTPVGFKGEDKGDGQHYHFFALLGLIAAAEASTHNGFDAWGYKSNRLVKGFLAGAPWADTAYRVADPGNRNHSPLYWLVLRRYPNSQTIKDVVSKKASQQEYSYFFSSIGPLWALAGRP